MKTVLITGCNSTVGMAVTKTFVEQPAQLALQYYSDQAKANELKTWLDRKSVPNRFFQCDLTDTIQAKRLVTESLSTFGSIDVLINIIGPYVYKSVLELSPEEWQSDIDLNLNTCFNTTHFALDALRASQGHIINFAFSGVENTKAWPMSTGYCAAKTAVAALSKSLAVALAPSQVRVNVICPGLVDDEDIGAEERQQMASQIPFGRPVRAEEIGQTVSWLVWNSPETMTGTLLNVSGAWEY